MNSLNISNRLKKVARCVENDSIVADIGCDHAYTAIYLIKNKIANKVIAMDINKGPLEKAKKNISNNGLDDYIETRLSDGGKRLTKGEVDTILISGMGGKLTNKILKDSIEVVSECKQLVLQPQSEIHLVREYVENIGFYIKYEDMFIDEGKYYVIINALKKYDNYTADIDVSYEEKLNKDNINKRIFNNDMLTQKELFNRYGEYLLKSKNETLYSFLNYKMKKTEEILDKLNKVDNTTSNKDRIEELNVDLYYIREGLRFYEN